MLITIHYREWKQTMVVKQKANFTISLFIYVSSSSCITPTTATGFIYLCSSYTGVWIKSKSKPAHMQACGEGMWLDYMVSVRNHGGLMVLITHRCSSVRVQTPRCDEAETQQSHERIRIVSVWFQCVWKESFLVISLFVFVGYLCLNVCIHMTYTHTMCMHVSRMCRCY